MNRLPPAWWYYGEVLAEEFFNEAQPFFSMSIDSLSDNERRQMLFKVMLATEKRMSRMAREIRAQSVFVGQVKP